MSLVLQIPPYTQFLQPVRRFSAEFNNPTLNKYDFGVDANTDQPFLKVRRELIYLFDTFSFSASMEEGLFLEAVDTVSGEPSTKVSIRVPTQKNRLIYRDPIPLVNYIDNSQVLFFAYTEQDDTLSITFNGVLSQPAALVGISDIFAQITCNVYEIRNKDWINNFLSRTKDGLGRNLLT